MLLRCEEYPPALRNYRVVVVFVVAHGLKLEKRALMREAFASSQATSIVNAPTLQFSEKYTFPMLLEGAFERPPARL